MPTYKITDPNTGRTVKITGDSPPTEAELENIFSSIQPKPEFVVDPEALRKSPKQQRRELLDEINRDLGVGGQFATGAGRGLTTVGRAVGIAEKEDPTVTQAFEQLAEVRPAAQIGEVVGEAAPFLPAGVAAGGIKTLAPRVVASAGVGATEAGLVSRGRGQSEQQQAESAVLGGTIAGTIESSLPLVGRMGSALIRKVTGSSPTSSVIDDLGNPTIELQEALEKSGLTFDDLSDQAQRSLSQAPENVDVDQFAREQFLRGEGIEPTKAQVTRSADDFQLQQEAAKTSGRVRDALEQQESVLTTRFNQAVLDTGGRPDQPTNTVVDALVDKATVLDQEISDLYTEARQLVPEDKNVRFSNLARKLQELAPANRRTGGAIEVIVGDLKSKGVLNDDFEVVGRISVETAEDVRKLMNELYDPQNGFANSKLRELKNTLDDDVFLAAGRDTFRAARKAKADFEKDLARAKISKFDDRKANLVRDVLENKVNPDTFANDVVFSKKWRASDIKQLKDYISDTPDGAVAFDDLKSDVLTAIKDKSFIGPEDAMGNKALSRAALERELNRIGDKKLGVLFTKEERDFLNKMLKLSRLREPVRGTATGKGPTAQAVASLEKKLQSLPIMGSLVDFVDIDASGRLALKAKPEIGPRTATALEQGARGVLPAAGAALAIEEQ